MSTVRVDDRTPEQQKTHTWLVTATDRCLSGWGGASRGTSKCAWACESLKIAQRVCEWVSSRSEMQYVNVTNRPWYPRAKHVHIYVVEAGHPALEGEGR